jgi:hypothetical protein
MSVLSERSGRAAQARSRAYDLAATVIHIAADALTRWAGGEPVCLGDARRHIVSAIDAAFDDFELEIRGDRPLAD